MGRTEKTWRNWERGLYQPHTDRIQQALLGVGYLEDPYMALVLSIRRLLNAAQFDDVLTHRYLLMKQWPTWPDLDASASTEDAYLGYLVLFAEIFRDDFRARPKLPAFERLTSRLLNDTLLAGKWTASLRMRLTGTLRMAEANAEWAQSWQISSPLRARVRERVLQSAADLSIPDRHRNAVLMGFLASMAAESSSDDEDLLELVKDSFTDAVSFLHRVTHDSVSDFLQDRNAPIYRPGSDDYKQLERLRVAVSNDEPLLGEIK